MAPPSRRPFPRWPSFGVLLLGAAYLTLRWDAIPERWVIHWGLRGEPNGWATRTPLGVYGILVLPLVLVAINEVGAAMRRSRASSDASGAGASMRGASLDFARIATFGVAIMTTFLAVVLPLGPRMPPPVLLSLAIAPLIACLLAAGARLNATLRAVREREGAAKVEGYHSVYYANRNDSRLWVPKVTGMGWTINFSHPLAWPMFLLLLAVPIVAIALSAAAR
jgi:uncharacterized membrane protein